ncbi:hypothetical protein CHLNCDRAFT_144845 [Chlorella variabilis]|uniref:Uncharacterized protein n=1 Tax=Chlorella variabilis TaxID=554065 RepID=E1ZD52_CHLVA|nr:hypothetical protein CHLNCDRAFT_144845 [Chlorella variabilis]EFN56358.1 hypothetical protein CHLNCDRAFT_144845 [Chlorella variabilis]|eukprot:XP_005848460.1 hypothetical protein CHLNCDRAFT_144845 [Chlorella variabilis]
MYSPMALYSPLAPDPLPPGPRVTSPAAPPLRLLLRVFNVALAAAALLVIGKAIWMFQEYKHGGDAPPPAGPPEAEENMAGARPAAALPAALGVLAAAAAGRPGWQLAGHWLQAAVAGFPWFIYLVGCTGVYCLLTALCGLVGVKRDRRAHLSAYIALMALLVLWEAGATLLMLTDNSWRGRIPDDPSGRWREALGWVDANERPARLAAVGALILQIGVLAAASWLQAIYTAAYEAWVDDCEEQSERVREALARTVVQTYAGGGASSWSARLRSKYGVEASALEAATLAARQVAALQDDRV